MTINWRTARGKKWASRHGSPHKCWADGVLVENAFYVDMRRRVVRQYVVDAGRFVLDAGEVVTREIRAKRIQLVSNGVASVRTA